jgi:hypothetical protein
VLRRALVEHVPVVFVLEHRSRPPVISIPTATALRRQRQHWIAWVVRPVEQVGGGGEEALQM